MSSVFKQLQLPLVSLFKLPTKVCYIFLVFGHNIGIICPNEKNKTLVKSDNSFSCQCIVHRSCGLFAMFLLFLQKFLKAVLHPDLSSCSILLSSLCQLIMALCTHLNTYHLPLHQIIVLSSSVPDLLSCVERLPALFFFSVCLLGKTGENSNFVGRFHSTVLCKMPECETEISSVASQCYTLTSTMCANIQWSLWKITQKKQIWQL